MPRRVKPKSELVFRAAKARARSYLLADGNGLALRVQPNGTKTWLFRYRRPSTGKENFHSLGPYPDITLTDARRSATTARNLVREGIDPVAYRQAESIARKRMAEGAFHLVAQRWLDFKRKEWADETYRKAEFVVREYLTPALRNNPISTLATPEVKPVLEAISVSCPPEDSSFTSGCIEQSTARDGLSRKTRDARFQGHASYGRTRTTRYGYQCSGSTTGTRETWRCAKGLRQNNV
ncbi:integrase arm-type DNA-binding domain-containing protein [Paraburkholderia sediminicola]|uniref:Integrase arm-type DNA-binding domain-containing protein n=1 Tax=Paraburkholderia metrosideri TaxID=580937 RepID=A0ABW9E3U6_9BURK